MKKLSDCPLRIVQTKYGVNKQLVCSGGLNFLLVGEDAMLCYHCPVPKAGLDELIDCSYSEIYTVIRSTVGSQVTIEYDVDCYATTEQERCGECPNQRTCIKDSLNKEKQINEKTPHTLGNV